MYIICTYKKKYLLYVCGIRKKGEHLQTTLDRSQVIRQLSQSKCDTHYAIGNRDLYRKFILHYNVNTLCVSRSILT